LVGSDAGTNQGGYGVVWSNALPGLYILQARALDSRGAFGFSDAVKIYILGTNQPPTNPLPWCRFSPSTRLPRREPTGAAGYSNSTRPLPVCFRRYWLSFLEARLDQFTLSRSLMHRRGSFQRRRLCRPSGSVTIPEGERSARITSHPFGVRSPRAGERRPETATPTNLHRYLAGWPQTRR
jgi:hypothetical protein